jgi:hypothetical protein
MINPDKPFVFGIDFFKTHQNKLLWLLNTPIINIWFRWALRINGQQSNIGKRKITKIVPNAIFWTAGRYKRVEVRTHNKFSKRLYYAFKPIWYAMHTWDIIFANNFAPNLNLGFDTLTVYPSAGSVSPIDGRVMRTGVNESFSTIRSGAGNSVWPDQTEGNIFLVASSTSNQYQELVHWYHCFDTSALTSAATISAAVMSLFGSGKDNQLGSPDYHVASASLASTSALANGDFQNIGRTSFGSVAYASWSTTGYNNITLNASGIAAISKTGVTQFSGQLSWDILNSTTGLTWSNSAGSRFNAYFADQTGTTNDPKLVITYTTPTSYTATYSEAITLTETFNRATTRSFPEVITLVQTLTKATTRSFATEVIAVSETFSKAATKSFSEVLSIVEAFSRQVAASRTFNETVTLVESFTKGFAKSFSERINIKEWLWRWWRKPTSGFTQQTQQSSSWTQETPVDNDWDRE